MSAKLVITFTGANGKNITFGFNHADTNVEASDVQTLAQTIITNGSIYANPPTVAKNAELAVTTKTQIPLSGE